MNNSDFKYRLCNDCQKVFILPISARKSKIRNKITFIIYCIFCGSDNTCVIGKLQYDKQYNRQYSLKSKYRSLNI
jgi:RNase P subunit RPR2